MGFSSKKQSQISYKTVYFFALCLCRSNGVIDYEIYRSERDIFTKPDYDSTEPCSSYNAECIDNDNCDQCRCSEGRNTLIINGDDILECVGNEEIVQELESMKVFKLENADYNKCLQVDSHAKMFVVGANCTLPTHDSDILWIWTETSDKQLMNIETLKCMKEPATSRMKTRSQ